MSGEELNINNNYTTALANTNFALNEKIISSTKAQRARELEESFSYDGYQIARKELFAHTREPAMTIREDSITFNTACIDGLEDVVYVHIMFNTELKRIVVEGCSAHDKDALRWCVKKPDKRRPRKMTCEQYATLIYEEMGWEKGCRYKMLGYLIEFEGRKLYIFDLLVPETFPESKQRNAVDQDIIQNTNNRENPVDTRKGSYSNDIASGFGVSVDEHSKEVEVTEIGGYVSMAMLTGQRTGQEHKLECEEENNNLVGSNPGFG